MQRVLALLAAAVVALMAVVFAASAAADSANSTITTRQNVGGSVNFLVVPPERQPACLLAITDEVFWSGDVLAHASQDANGLIRVWGRARFDFTAGEYTASAGYTYTGSGMPNANGSVVVTTHVDVDFKSKSAPGVVQTTFTFVSGAGVFPDIGIVPFSGGVPEFPVCR